MTETAYIPGMRSYDTLKDVLDYAIDEATRFSIQVGRQLGAKQERLLIIQSMLGNGCDWSFIQKITRVDQLSYVTFLQNQFR